MIRQNSLAGFLQSLRGIRKRLLFGRATILSACIFSLYYSVLSIWEVFLPAADPAFLAKLQSAEHAKVVNPAGSFNRLIENAKLSWKFAITNAFGREIRDISYVNSGEPRAVFLSLSFFSDYGEIVWINEDWKRIHVTDETNMERNAAVNAIVTAIENNGGCLVKAGPNRHLVVKKDERKQYEAALRELGWTRAPAWLVGSIPPWETNRLWNVTFR